MKNHIQWVHKKKKPFKCGICEKRFTRKDVVAKHIACIHEKMLQKLNNKIVHIKMIFTNYRIGRYENIGFKSVFYSGILKDTGIKY